MLELFTANIAYEGPDRLQVTRSGASGEGRIFSPSWSILRPAQMQLKRARSVEAAGDPEAAERIRAAAWATYRSAYGREMKDSERDHRAEWRALCARERVVLVCFCPKREFCHRGLLAEMLALRGAHDNGELVRNGAGEWTPEGKSSQKPGTGKGAWP